MVKIYFNQYHNTAILINDSDKTYKLLKTSDLIKQDAFYYKTNIYRIREVLRMAQVSGYVRG